MSTPQLQPTITTQEQLQTERQFLSELTELSQKYRLGVTGDALLFIMEWDDDGRTYTTDSESRLFFR